MKTARGGRFSCARATAGALLAAVCALAAAGCSSLGNDGTQGQFVPVGKSDTKPESKVALGLNGTDGKVSSQSVTTSATSETRRTEAVGSASADQTGAIKAAEALLAANARGNVAYRVGAADVLEISVFKVPELSKSVQVSDNGTITLALVGEVPVIGRTAQEIEKDLTKALGAKYLQNPQVSVFVKEYNSQRVTVEGSVRTPGLYPIRGRSTLLQMLAACGGLTEIADSSVVVFRQVGGKRSAAKFDVNEIRSGDAPDPELQPGDVVVVTNSTGKEAFNNFTKLAPIARAFILF